MSTTTKRTPATTRIKVVLSISNPLSWAIACRTSLRSRREDFKKHPALEGAGIQVLHGLREPQAEQVERAPPEDPHRLRLFDARAAALNQGAEYDNKQYAGDNSDDRDTVHTDPPFLGLLKERFERIQHDDHCRSEHDQEQRRKNEKDQREDELDGGLGSLLFHLLNALGAQRVGVGAQGLADAG